MFLLEHPFIYAVKVDAATQVVGRPNTLGKANGSERIPRTQKTDQHLGDARVYIKAKQSLQHEPSLNTFKVCRDVRLEDVSIARIVFLRKPPAKLAEAAMQQEFGAVIVGICLKSKHIGRTKNPRDSGLSDYVNQGLIENAILDVQNGARAQCVIWFRYVDDSRWGRAVFPRFELTG